MARCVVHNTGGKKHTANQLWVGGAQEAGRLCGGWERMGMRYEANRMKKDGVKGGLSLQ